MSTAQDVLVTYGLLALLYGLILGIPLARARMNAPAASRHLVSTHVSALMQGPLHLGVAFALGAVAFDSTLAVVAAALLVAGSALELGGGTVNWLLATGDQFAERSPGFLLNSLTGPLAIPGLALLAYGVVTRL